MLGRMELRGNRPRDGRHCDLCGCSFPAVRCDKCGSQIFCLSCDDMYHRHPKRRFHLRKAVDPQPSAGQARPVLPAKASQVAPGDPSKMPLPPPRKKKPGRSFFDTFRRGSPSSERDVSPTLPKKEYNWTDRLGSIKKFMSNRPLPPLPNGNSHVQENSSSPDVPSDKHDLSFIHKRVDEKPPQLPQRNMKPQMNAAWPETQNSLDTSSSHQGHFNGGMANSSADGPNFARNRGFSLGGEVNQNSDANDGPKYKTINRHPYQGHMKNGAYPPDAPGGMHLSTSATDLHKLPPEAMGMPHAYPHYPMNVPPHYPYPMYPQYPNYPQYFGSSWANLAGIPQNNNDDVSDHSEASSRPFSNKRHHFRKRAKRSQSVMVDRMGFPGPYYPFGPFPPGYAPGGWAPPQNLMETSTSPSGSVNSLNRIGRTRRGRRKTTSEDEDDDYEEDEFSPSSSPISRTKSSSSERPRANKKPVRTGTDSSSEEQDKKRGGKDGGGNHKLKRRGSNTRLTSPTPKPMDADSKSNSKSRRRGSDGASASVAEKQEPESRKEENVGELTAHTEVQSSKVNSTKTSMTPPTEWQCPHCTYINQPNARICQVCCKTAARSPESSQAGPGSTPAPDSNTRKISESSEVSCSSPEKAVGGGSGRSSTRERRDMAVLNSALDEAEKEISRGLEELMKMKEDFTAEGPSQSKQEDPLPPSNQDAKTAETSKPVYKSSGKLRSGILDKLTSSNQFTTPTKSSASTSTNTETQTTLDVNPESIRRTSTSSTTSETFNSPTAQSPEIPLNEREGKMDGLRRDSSCQTQQSSLADYLQRKKSEEESAYLGRSNYDYNAYPLNRYDGAVSPSPFMYADRGAFGYGLMQRSHSRASLFAGRYNEGMDYVDRGYGLAPMYRSVSRGSLSGDYPDGRFAEFSNLRKPDYYLSMEELVERRRQDNIRAQGLELVRMIREAEQQGFTADDIQAALNNCGKQNPVDWLQENWRNMVDNVVTLSTNYGNDKKENNDIGVVAENEARDALRLHKGNIWAAVTECVEGRQRKFLALSARGKFSRKSIVDALSSSQGDVETAHDFLTKAGSKPFLMRIWGAGEGVQNQDGALSGSLEDIKKTFPQYSASPRKYDDDGESEEEIWVEDDIEEYDDEWVEEEELGQASHEPQDLSNEVSDVIKSPESEDRSEYIDAFEADDRSISSPSSDDLFFILPEQQQKPKKSKGTSFLSKLAAFRKQKQQSYDEEAYQKKTNSELESCEAVAEETSEQNKSYGPLNLLKNTLSAIKDTVTGSSSRSDKLNQVFPEKRTIIVSDIGTKLHAENFDESSTKLTSIKKIDPDEEFKQIPIQTESIQENVDDVLKVVDDGEIVVKDIIEVVDKEVITSFEDFVDTDMLIPEVGLKDVIYKIENESKENTDSISVLKSNEVIKNVIEEKGAGSLFEHARVNQTHELPIPVTTAIKTLSENNIHEEQHLKLKNDAPPDKSMQNTELFQITDDTGLKAANNISLQKNKQSIVGDETSVIKSEIKESETLLKDQPREISMNTNHMNSNNATSMKEDNIPQIQKTQEQYSPSNSDNTNLSIVQNISSTNDTPEKELSRNSNKEESQHGQNVSNENVQHFVEAKHGEISSFVEQSDDHNVKTSFQSSVIEKEVPEPTKELAPKEMTLVINTGNNSIHGSNNKRLKSTISETDHGYLDNTLMEDQSNKIETNMNNSEENSILQNGAMKNEISNDLSAINKLDVIDKLKDIQFIDKEVKDDVGIEHDDLNFTDTKTTSNVFEDVSTLLNVKTVDQSEQTSLNLEGANGVKVSEIVFKSTEVENKLTLSSSFSEMTEDIIAAGSISEHKNATTTKEFSNNILNQSDKNEENSLNNHVKIDNSLTVETADLKPNNNVKLNVSEESKVIIADKEKETVSPPTLDSSKESDKPKTKPSSTRSKNGKYKLTRSNSSVSEILEKLEQKFQSSTVTNIETVPRKKSIASNQIGEISSLLSSKEKDKILASTSNSGIIEKENTQMVSSVSRDSEISLESTVPVNIDSKIKNYDKPIEHSTDSSISVKRDAHSTESSNKLSEIEALPVNTPDEILPTSFFVSENNEELTDIATGLMPINSSISKQNLENRNIEEIPDFEIANKTSNISSNIYSNEIENLSSPKISLTEQKSSIASENLVSSQTTETLNSEQSVQNTESLNSKQSVTNVSETINILDVETTRPTNSNQSIESIHQTTQVLNSEHLENSSIELVHQSSLPNQSNSAVNVETAQNVENNRIDNIIPSNIQNSGQLSEANIQEEFFSNVESSKTISVQKATDSSVSFEESSSKPHSEDSEGSIKSVFNETVSNAELTSSTPISPSNETVTSSDIRSESSQNISSDSSPGTSSSESEPGVSSSESSPSTSSRQSSSSTSSAITTPLGTIIPKSSDVHASTDIYKVHNKPLRIDNFKSQNSEESDESILSQTPPSPAGILRNRFEGVREESPLRAMSPVRPQSPFSRLSFRARKEAIAQEKQRESKMTVESKPWFLQKVCPEPIKTTTLPKRSIKQQLEMERRVRKMVSDRKCRTYRKAEIVVQLMDMNFEEEEALQAANECATLEQAISYLQQECLLCTGYYPVSQIISMVHCPHKACRDCIRAYFTVQIRDRTIMELLCPFCNEPDIGDEDVAQDYFNHLDIMLKKLVEYDIHELFQRKLRDRVLMKDPNFRWCSQCSSGFIANPNLKRLICPDCNAVTCATCRRPWEREHQGISCEAFAALKDASDPEAQAAGLAKLLTEDGIDCPSCHFRYALAKGGCMHFRCIQCLHDFCSGCSRPFKMGQKCGLSEFCAKLGLHAHHPRNCLFYLRDKDPEDLQRLLDMNDIDYNQEPPEGMDLTAACQVMEQKETADGMLDDFCGKDVQEGYAGLCRIHYVEYLGQLVNRHKVDPIQIFENDDLELVLKRASIRLPPKRYRESDAEYREKLVKMIQEELPIDGMDGS